jgi:hypothetical protein
VRNAIVVGIVTLSGLALAGPARASSTDLAARPASTAQTRSFVGTAWKVIKCAAGIAVLVGGNILAGAKIRKLGGVWKVAKRTLSAKGKLAKVKILTAIAGEISGVANAAASCGA